MAELSQSDDWMLPKDVLDLVSESNHEISKLAEGMVKLLEINRDDDFLMYHGMLARIQQLSEMQFQVLRLDGKTHEEAIEAWGERTDMKDMVRIYKGLLP